MMRHVVRLLAVAAVVGLAVPVRANPVLDFSTGAAGPGGTINVKNGVVTGKNIFIDLMTVLGAPKSFDGIYNLDGAGNSKSGGPVALLNFTTGPGGGTLSIVGRIPKLGITTNVPLITSGTFTSWSFDPKLGFFSGGGTDVVNPILLTALHIPPGSMWDFFGFSSVFGKKNTVISTDFRTNAPVPEPGTLLLLGSGLAALARFRRRTIAAAV